MIGFPIALVVANGFEWYAHKHLLHGTPRKGQPRYSPAPTNMKSHWAHHKIVRTSAYGDDGYREGLKNWRVSNEVKSLLALTAVTSLVAPVAPFFTLGTYYAAGRYFYVHRRSHLDPEWGKKTIPWHYDHHMNSNQDANWCVTRPWFDYLMGTRVISSDDLAESNPLGITLPAFVEKRVNRLARRLLPNAFARLDENRREEAGNRRQGIDLPMPEVTAAA
ncbi:MAG: sterol desaturase family protein [Moraxellaceae bacterium]|nr:sterol desaturase family protein [Moraxellaceae bacterium]